MATPFVCVRCGAPLVLPEDPSLVDVSCGFCKTNTPVPSEHLEALRRARSVPARPASTAPRGMPAVAIVGLTLGFLGVCLGIFAATHRRSSGAPAVASTTPSAPAGSARPGAPDASTSMATHVASFGGRGTGPGLFNDARHLAVDADGNVFVAEYETGRIHEFDSSGKFVKIIPVPPKNGDLYVFGLVADWRGALYVSRDRDVVKLSVKDGSVLKTFPQRPRKVAAHATPGEMCAEALGLDAEANLYVASDCTPEGVSVNIASPYSLVKLDPNGRQLGHYAGVGGADSQLAVDGDGTTYVTGWLDDKVAVYDAHGRFSNKWGQRGHAAGDFSGVVSAVALDGHGHVFVADSGGVKVFDKGGKFRGRFAEKGGRGLAIGSKGDAYVLGQGVDQYRVSVAED